MHNAEAQLTPLTTPLLHATSAAQLESATGHVLVIEGDALARSVLMGVLQGADHVVEAAGSAAHASAWLAERDFDVVVASADTPGVSGVELLESLRVHLSDTEVILLAREASVRDAVAYLQAGAFDLLEKPISPEEVETSVARAVERRRLRATKALYQASQAVFANLDPEQLPQRIVELSMQVMAADDASLMLPDEQGRLHLVYSHRLREVFVNEPGQGVAGRLADERRPALINDVISPGSRYDQGSGDQRIRSSIVFPLTAGERLLGVLNLNRVASTRPFRGADLGLAGLLASQTALAMENARLLRDKQRQVRELKEAQARLVESQRMAAVGQVSAGLVHEVNNPAAYVLSNLFTADELLSELLERAGDAALREELTELREVVCEASEGARRIREILRDVRALATAEGSDEQPEVIDLNEAVRSALRPGRAAAAVQGSAQVHAHLGADVHVVGDASRLSQAVLNLLVNAAQAVAAVPGRSHRIRLSTRRRGDQVLLRIADTGEGIPEALLGDIFEAFFTTRPANGGTGLGLAISRDIVRDHGGTIEVESVPGVGSTFTVALPAAPQAGDARPDELPARLLFVTSDPAARRAYAHRFGQRHEVTVAESPAAAAELLRCAEGIGFDLVICEPGPDGATGQELARLLAERSPALAERLVFVTDTEPDPATRELLRATGAPRTTSPLDDRWLQARLAADSPQSSVFS